MDPYGLEDGVSRIRQRRKEKFADSEEKRAMRKALKHSQRGKDKKKLNQFYRGCNPRDFLEEEGLDDID